jgi:hypothetical protein
MYYVYQREDGGHVITDDFGLLVYPDRLMKIAKNYADHIKTLGGSQAVSSINAERIADWEDRTISPRILIERWVYVMTDGALCKIGVSKDVERRRKEIEKEIGSQLQIIYTLKTRQAFEIERSLHKQFQEKHHHQEWFALTSDDLAEIEALREKHLDE